MSEKIQISHIAPVPSGPDLEGSAQPTDTTVGRSDPQGIPKKKFPFLLTFLLIFLSLLATLAVYLFLQVRTLTLEKTTTSLPTPTPVAPADPTANWQTFADSINGFSFKYPQEYSLGNYSINDPLSPQLINNRIDWSISKYSASKCRGDCPIILTTETKNINPTVQAAKILGWIGGIGGEIPQSYITYEILLPSGKYLDINLWELLRGKSAMAEDYPLDRKPGVINPDDITIFDQILSTFKFTENQTSLQIPGWKFYTSTEFTFQYPGGWTIGQGGQVIVSDVAGASITIFSKNMSMYNECMNLDRTESKNGLMIKFYSYVSSGEMCTNEANVANKEVWITKDGGDGFQPGIIYKYNTKIYPKSGDIITTLISTFKFTN